MPGSNDEGELDSTAVGETPTATDELEPQLKYERLGADVKTILQGATATCLALSEKVLALGTSVGNIHILDYSGNEVKRFSLHSKAVKHISFDDKAEYFASCCGDNYISVSSLYSDETNKFTFKRPITVVALEPRYASRKTREFVTGDVSGRLKLSSQGWLGRSDHVLHQGEGTIRAVNWHSSTLVWANEVGIKVYDTNMHQFVGSIKRPKGGRFADCFDCQLYVHDGDTAEVLYVAWPDCIKVADILTHIDGTSGAVSKALRVSASIPTDYFCLGVVPHGQDLAVLVFVTDADPDQDQVGAAAAADGQHTPAAAAHSSSSSSSSKDQQQQRGELTMQPLPQQQPGSSPSKQQEGEAAGEGDSAAAVDGSSASAAAAFAAASGPSAGPINIPQPVRRTPRAANAFVTSPSGPSLLQAAAAAAAAAGAAADADGSSGVGVSPSSSPRPAAPVGAVGDPGVVGSSSSSPDVDKGRGAAAAAAAAAGGVQRSPSRVGGRPPLPGYSRSSSVASRGSVGSSEGLTAPYIPPGHPLRPELRILSPSHFSDTSHSSGHTHTTAAAAAAGTSKMQQQQQQQQVCSTCSELASDALSVKGYQHYLPADYHLVPSYGNEIALLSGAAAQQKPHRSKAAAHSSSSSSSSKGKTAGSSGSRSVSGAPARATAAAASSKASGSDAKQQQQRQEGWEQEQQQGKDTPSAVTAGDTPSAEPSASKAVEGGSSSSTAGAEVAAAADAAAVVDTDAAAADSAAAAAAEDTLVSPSDTVESAAAVESVAAGAVDDAAAAAAVVDDVLEDFREFMYFIVSPQDIVIGRHRDIEDRISWCLSVGRFEAALSLAEADRTTPQDTWDTVVQSYLDFLTSGGRWSEAATMLPRLLKDSTAAWERWLFTFAQARQLPLLAPVLPVKDPLLPSQAYDLVLQALLVDPALHDELLTLVASWPHSIFHPTKLIDAIAQRMQRPGCESRELWQVLALLYKGQGRPDLSLAIYLQLQLPSVFDFIQEHGLLLYLDRNAYLLMAIDDKRALELLATHLDTLPPGAVVPGLLDAMSVCESKGDEGERETWRHRLFNYLDRVFTVDPSAVCDYAELCVHLYADYCPARLMDFLQGSQTYPLEAALEVAQQRGLIDEQVYVLSRMGNSRAALRLIIRAQQDIPRAIEFVRLQRDEELWEELIDWALSSADTTGQLLDHIGGNINPLRVIQKIPEGLAIDKLRDRLRAIIADFRTQTSLREGCNAILRSDCLHLVQRLTREVKRALPAVWLQRHHAHTATAATTAAAAADGSDAAADEGLLAAGPGALGAKASPKGAAAAAVAAVAAAGGSSGCGYLPRSVGGKGPQWLKYQCGSGQLMQPGSSQDVPAVAVHALATAAAAGGVGGGGVGLPIGGQSSRMNAPSIPGMKGVYSSYGVSSNSVAGPLSSPQPCKVWIGRTGGAGGEDGFGAVGPADGDAVQQEEDAVAGGAAKGGGSSAASRRSSHRQQWQRGSTSAVNLPSLVAA